jgi:hypothetical protein
MSEIVSLKEFILLLDTNEVHHILIEIRKSVDAIERLENDLYKINIFELKLEIQ